MPNNKKTRKSGHQPAEDLAGRSRKKNKRKPLSEAMKWLLAFLCSIAVVLVVSFGIGQYTLTHEGKDSPEDLAKAFVSAMEHNSKSELKKCLLRMDNSYDSVLDTLMAYIRTEDCIKSVDYDRIEIRVMDPDAVAELEENLELRGIQDSFFLYMEVPIVREKDGGTYDTMTSYYMTGYQAKDKWFLYDVIKDFTYVLSGTDKEGNPVNPDEAIRLFNNKLVGGDDDIGYIPLDNTWYAMNQLEDGESNGFEGAVKDLAYVQETGDAVIHMVLLDTDKSIKELADQLYGNLTADKDAAVEIAVMETQINGHPAYHTGFYSQNADVFFFSWLIDTKDYDGNIRYLTLESTGTYKACSMYVTAFLLPDEYYNLYFSGLEEYEREHAEQAE